MDAKLGIDGSDDHTLGPTRCFGTHCSPYREHGYLAAVIPCFRRLYWDFSFQCLDVFLLLLMKSNVKAIGERRDGMGFFFCHWRLLQQLQSYVDSYHARLGLYSLYIFFMQLCLTLEFALGYWFGSCNMALVANTLIMWVLTSKFVQYLSRSLKDLVSEPTAAYIILVS